MARRMLAAIRRATIDYYFSTLQACEVARIVPLSARVEVLVILFSVIQDIQQLPLRQLLREAGDEAMEEFRYRVGPVNMFNPYMPDGHYELDLRVYEDRTVASLLVLLSEEPGENFANETYNGAVQCASEAPDSDR